MPSASSASSSRSGGFTAQQLLIPAALAALAAGLGGTKSRSKGASPVSGMFSARKTSSKRRTVRRGGMLEGHAGLALTSAHPYPFGAAAAPVVGGALKRRKTASKKKSTARKPATRKPASKKRKTVVKKKTTKKRTTKRAVKK